MGWEGHHTKHKTLKQKHTLISGNFSGAKATLLLHIVVCLKSLFSLLSHKCYGEMAKRPGEVNKPSILFTNSTIFLRRKVPQKTSYVNEWNVSFIHKCSTFALFYTDEKLNMLFMLAFNSLLLYWEFADVSLQAQRNSCNSTGHFSCLLAFKSLLKCTYFKWVILTYEETSTEELLLYMLFQWKSALEVVWWNFYLGKS